MSLGVSNKGNSGNMHIGTAGSPTFQAGIVKKSFSSFFLDFSASALPLPFFDRICFLGIVYRVIKIAIRIELISYISEKLFCIFTS